MSRFGATNSCTFISNHRSAATFEAAPGEAAVFELRVEFCVRGDVSGFCVHLPVAIPSYSYHTNGSDEERLLVPGGLWSAMASGEWSWQ